MKVVADGREDAVVTAVVRALQKLIDAGHDVDDVMSAAMGFAGVTAGARLEVVPAYLQHFRDGMNIAAAEIAGVREVGRA